MSIATSAIAFYIPVGIMCILYSQVLFSDKLWLTQLDGSHTLGDIISWQLLLFFDNNLNKGLFGTEETDKSSPICKWTAERTRTKYSFSAT